jgi:hypothetical protein
MPGLRFVHWFPSSAMTEMKRLGLLLLASGFVARLWLAWQLWGWFIRYHSR